MNENIEVCFYCKLCHPKVEASGMWHCPNPLCTGPGAHWFRKTLKSYEELSDGHHTVDEKELLDAGLQYMIQNPIKEEHKNYEELRQFLNKLPADPLSEEVDNHINSWLDSVSPEKPLKFIATEGYETYKIDDHTIGVRPKWISVKDRLPKHNESLGYTFDGTDIRKDIYFSEYCGRWESENTLGYCVQEKNITHWMPRPNPPEKLDE